METAIKYCKEHKYKRVFLWTVSVLHTARHLYQKFNFTLTEEKVNDEWTGDKLLEERWDLEILEEALNKGEKFRKTEV